MPHRAAPTKPASRRLRIEPLEPRRVLAAGVTVITHGAQISTGLPDWTVTMGQAILDRADGALTGRDVGSLFQHDATTGQWRAVGDAAWRNSDTLNDHIVLLYDWSEESFTMAEGWIDAAADNLFASLLAINSNLGGALQTTSFFDAALTGGGGGGVLDLHFIGHSRGAVLNSLVAARFDRWFSELTIDHITSLDGHPAGAMDDPGFVADNPQLNSRIFTYDNVRFADNYFQQAGVYEFGIPDGVRTDGAYNLQIPVSVFDNGGYGLFSGGEHSDVHAWYYGTITTPFAANYAGFSGAGRNNDGDASFPETWWGASGVPARAGTGFAYSSIAGADRSGLPITGAKIAAGALPTVFNGDLQQVSEFSGWEYHGGAGSASSGGSGDFYFELTAGGDDVFRRHNPLYFPRHTVAVEYDYWINDADATAAFDQLQVLLGGVAVESIPLSAMTNGFVRNHRASFTLPAAGRTATLEFRIVDGGGDGVESAVRIDNIELAIEPPAPSGDFDGDGDIDGNDFLRWQRGVGTFVTGDHGEGDADFDGNIAADDLAIWRGHFGMPANDSLTSSAGSGTSANSLSPAAISLRAAEPATTAWSDSQTWFIASGDLVNDAKAILPAHLRRVRVRDAAFARLGR